MIGAAVLGLVFTASRTAAAPILIDDFSQRDTSRALPQSVTVDSVGTMIGGSEFGLAGVPGGSRATFLGDALMDVDGFDRATINIKNSAGDSFFDFESSVGAKARTDIEYGAAPAPAMNLDATGQTALRIDLLGFDAPTGQSLQIDVRFFTGGGIASAPAALIATPGAQAVFITFPALSPAALADVDGILLSFRAPKGGDFRIDTISLVPEPSSLALLALAAAGLLARRRQG